MNSVGPTGSNGTLDSGSANNIRWEIQAPSGSAQNLKNTDTVGAGGATGGLEYNANTGNLKGKSFESSVSAATTVGFVGTSSFANSAVVSQTNTLTNEASDTSCFRTYNYDNNLKSTWVANTGCPVTIPLFDNVSAMLRKLFYCVFCYKYHKIPNCLFIASITVEEGIDLVHS